MQSVLFGLIWKHAWGSKRPGDIVNHIWKDYRISKYRCWRKIGLADALTFTEKKYKPRFAIDLATLTGAIIVALGSEYAGLFSNDNIIAQLYDGNKVGEKFETPS